MQKVKKGDNVQILLGKDRGKQAIVDRVLVKLGKVSMTGINTYKRHVRRVRDMEGGIIEINKPINLSNVAVVCPSCKKATRIGIKIEGEDKIRICKKCGKEIK